MITTPAPIDDHDTYIAYLLELGRPAILRLIRSCRIRAGSIKDTRQLAEFLWTITNRNRLARLERSGS